MAITTEEKYLLNNKAGVVANKVQLGTLIQNAESGGLAAGAVTATELATDAVETAKIKDLNVTTGKLAALAVTTAKIAALAVTTSELGADAVTNAKIADTAVSLEHLDSGIAMSHVVKFAGKFTTLGGDANEQASVAGVVAGDIVIASLQDKGATPRTILTAKAGTDVIDFIMSDDPSTDHIINYMVLRAAS